MALLTPPQQRKALTGLGFPLDRPGLGDDATLRRAIKDFQWATGLKLDGVWGLKTQEVAYYCGLAGGRISEHFTLREFACRCWERGHHGAKFCHGWPKVDRKLVLGLEVLRAANGGPVAIVNGYRCPPYNRQAGGASRSQHMRGTAADVSQNLTLKRVRALRVFRGIGYRRAGSNVKHVDMRSGSLTNPTTWPYG
jgi:zinc D-Ala-D-Ala carboxypeptidase